MTISRMSGLILIALRVCFAILKLRFLNKSHRLKYENNSKMRYSKFFDSAIFCGTVSNLNDLPYQMNTLWKAGKIVFEKSIVFSQTAGNAW